MASRKQALIDLRDKVKAREAYHSDFRRLEVPMQDMRYTLIPNDARMAYKGSLDAAKALHEAVLPGWGWRKDHWDGEKKPRYELFWVTYPSNWRVGHTCQYNDKNDARAWLLAILEAMIAQEESK